MNRIKGQQSTRRATTNSIEEAAKGRKQQRESSRNMTELKRQKRLSPKRWLLEHQYNAASAIGGLQGNI